MSVILDMSGSPITDMGGDAMLDMAGASAAGIGLLQAFSGNATGSIQVSGSVDATLYSFTGSAVGDFSEEASGSVSGVLPAFQTSASGSTIVGTISGAITASLPSLQGSAAGSTLVTLIVPAFRIYTVETDAHDARRMPVKDPDDVVDYAIDFDAIMTDGEVLNVIEATFSGLSEGSPPPAIDGSQVIFWVGDGASDTDGRVTIQATTNYGRTYERSAIIPIAEL